MRISLKHFLKKYCRVAVCILTFGLLFTVTTEAGAGKRPAPEPNISTTTVVDTIRSFTASQANGPIFTETNYKLGFEDGPDIVDDLKFTSLTVALNDGTVHTTSYQSPNFAPDGGIKASGSLSADTLQQHVANAMNSLGIDPDNVAAIVEYTVYFHTGNGGVHSYVHVKGGWDRVDIIVREIGSALDIHSELKTTVYYFND